MATAKVVRRKPEEERKTQYLRVRLTAEHYAMLSELARHRGIALSAWVTQALLDVAREEIRQREAKGEAPVGASPPRVTRSRSRP